MTDRRRFNWHVLDVLTSAIAESAYSQAEIIGRSGMRRTTYFAKMRGETAMTTDDIAAICKAIDADPSLVLVKAWQARPIGANMVKNTSVFADQMEARPTLTEVRAAEKLRISVEDLRTLSFETFGDSLDSHIREDAGHGANAQARGHANRRAVASLERTLSVRGRRDDHDLIARSTDPEEPAD